ncbi:CoA transferase [Mycolicibacterium komossense]|uniref:CoA transferase n=1 Tax=Mycolicibacterium komossense TaxID=1779 RepID=A0ABT3C886_9MYCO|nr:CoA transferase [Mycolicibacterium komossense]MCV7225678.1 CoA transferase [Mycolicibacterium komossense]
MGALGIADGVLRRAAVTADAIAAATGTVVDATELLTGRAALSGHAPQGRISAGGATQLIRAGDGWCALTLSRADDIAAVPALVGADQLPADPWPGIHGWAAQRSVAELVSRAVLLDLPVAALGETEASAPRVLGCGTAGPARGLDGLLVVDMTSMWAGPLCARLLGAGGATVVKVENPTRPDGTRAGDPRFFDWMNTGKLSYAVDFDTDRDALSDLLAVADIVLEGSRPAALARRGLGPHDCPPRPGRVWLSITGYGADTHRVAFGDDAAVAGGLVRRTADGPAFVGDAIADPLTGLTATAAVIEALAHGGGVHIGVAMAAVAATYASAMDAADTEALPVPPAAAPRASGLGADTAAVHRLVAERSWA